MPDEPLCEITPPLISDSPHVTVEHGTDRVVIRLRRSSTPQPGT
jgi:hypothetical protein